MIKMTQINPMKAARAEPEYIEELMNDDDWVAEEKFNGRRFIATFRYDRIHFTSKHESVKGTGFCERGLNIPHLSYAVKHLAGTVLDGEIIGPDGLGSAGSIMGASPAKAIAYQKAQGNAVYMVFDILYHRGVNVQSLPLIDRKELLSKVMNEWGNDNAHNTIMVKGKFKANLRHLMLSSGKEGIVLKNLYAHYIQDARDKKIWVKVKRQDSWDVVITGFTPPEKMSIKKGDTKPTITKFYKNKWIGAIEYGFYDPIGNCLESLGTVSGMPEIARKEFTKRQKEYIGNVIEVEGQEIFKNGVIQLPRFIRLRPDKPARECTFESLFITKGKKAKLA